jgi:hypothetical protein
VIRRARRVLAVVPLACALTLVGSSTAEGSPNIRYGVQDDAWLIYGAGPVASRLGVLRRLGVDVVRFTLRWDQIAPRKPANPRNHRDRAYSWRLSDPALKALRDSRIPAVVTLLGAPRWANGGRSFNWAPTDSSSFADFAFAAATRYPWVRQWTIWNEPNQSRWLRPTTARIYVERLLNPAYEQLHRASADVRVAGGVTAPRGGSRGVSPVAWIRDMRAAGAQLDAYAHHPYPLQPQIETPWSGGCGHCSTITLADLDRLLREVGRNFPGKRIWLTEYGYQTNPPDRLLGVSMVEQAAYMAAAAHRAYLAQAVDMLIYFLVRDDIAPTGWQSGLFTARGAAKLARAAFHFPLVQSSRRGYEAALWGQVRAGTGRQRYRVREYRRGRWLWIAGTGRTDTRGFFSTTVRARPGTLLQAWSPGNQSDSLIVRVR